MPKKKTVPAFAPASLCQLCSPGDDLHYRPELTPARLHQQSKCPVARMVCYPRAESDDDLILAQPIPGIDELVMGEHRDPWPVILTRIPFFKTQASGQRLDHQQPQPLDEQIALPAFARAVCRRNVAVGADGLILVENPRTAGCDFAWRFFNADGSEADMCLKCGLLCWRYAVINSIVALRLSFKNQCRHYSCGST